MQQLGHAVVHPTTGELVTLDAPVEELAATFHELYDLKHQAEAALKKLDTELRDRLGDGRELTAGGWRVKASWRRVWDGDELDGVLRDLYDRGRIAANDTVDVLRREIKVSGTAALALANRLDKSEAAAIKRCAGWVAGRVQVTLEETQ